MSKGPMSKGCPRRRGEARADDKMHSAHSANLKRQQRARQNQLVATLDSLLPTEARCKPFKGAGPRSTGLQGRSVLNVLADCVQLIKTAHLNAAALVADAAGPAEQDHEDKQYMRAAGAHAEGEPLSHGERSPRNVTVVTSFECGLGPEAPDADRTPSCSFHAPWFWRTESGTAETRLERDKWLDFYAQQACGEIFEGRDSGLSLEPGGARENPVS